MEKRIVKVVWLDAQSSSTIAYSEHEIPHAPIEIHTIGWLLRQDEAGITVAGEYCSDATFRSTTFVPTGMVKSVVDLTAPKRSRTKKKAAPPGTQGLEKIEADTQTA